MAVVKRASSSRPDLMIRPARKTKDSKSKVAFVDEHGNAMENVPLNFAEKENISKALRSASDPFMGSETTNQPVIDTAHSPARAPADDEASATMLKTQALAALFLSEAVTPKKVNGDANRNSEESPDELLRKQTPEIGKIARTQSVPKPDLNSAPLKSSTDVALESKNAKEDIVVAPKQTPTKKDAIDDKPEKDKPATKTTAALKKPTGSATTLIGEAVQVDKPAKKSIAAKKTVNNATAPVDESGEEKTPVQKAIAVKKTPAQAAQAAKKSSEQKAPPKNSTAAEKTHVTKSNEEKTVAKKPTVQKEMVTKTPAAPVKTTKKALVVKKVIKPAQTQKEEKEEEDEDEDDEY